jgi:hypothetical protein
MLYKMGSDPNEDPVRRLYLVIYLGSFLVYVHHQTFLLLRSISITYIQ